MRRAVLAAWLITVAWLTLLPVPRTGDPEDVASPWCIVCGDRGSADAILNLLFFTPLGVALANGCRSAATVWAAGTAISVAVEVAQVAVPGRYATFGDVVWNGLGALAGFLAVGLLSEHSRSARPWWGAIAGGLVGGAFIVAGTLLEHAPTRADYYAQWTADLGHMPQYGGRVLVATLDGLAAPDGRLDASVDASRRLTTDWTLEARAVKGPPPTAVSPIFSIYDETEAEILVLGAHGEDLVLRERTRAKALRFDHPDVRIEDALAKVAVGDTVAIAARRVGQARCLLAAGMEVCGLGYTPGRTWGLLAFLEGVPEEGRRAIDAIWMMALFLPVGFLSSSVVSVARNGLIPVAGMTVAVLATRLSAPPAWEVLGVCAGLALGWLAARLARRVVLRWSR